HNEIKTWAVGTEHDGKKWRSIFRQLVANGYLEIDIGHYGGLKLTAKSRKIAAISEVWFRDESQLNTSKQSTVSKNAEFREDLELAKTNPMWEVLREWRAGVAKENKMPAYIILRDRALMDLVNKKPKTLNELAEINGIGKVKLELYGQLLLDIINS
ncbi:MAG: HRDC domain-containing protein, partial [Candidatus Oxydemutatoraceae bacterium WSBS_2016_MAG_OTU14]